MGRSRKDRKPKKAMDAFDVLYGDQDSPGWERSDSDCSSDEKEDVHGEWELDDEFIPNLCSFKGGLFCTHPDPPSDDEV